VIRLARPFFDERELAAAAAVVRSGALVQGAEVARFEALCAERCGRRHAIAVSSGTAALEVALEVLGIGAGDEVLCPDLSWPSPAHAIARRGATPVLVDVDDAEWNATAGAFANARGPRTRAAIVIDQFGMPARLAEISRALADLPIIEDSACALGSRIGAIPCGSAGAISCLSFHPRKIVTTGEGGMCLTDDDALAAELRARRNHGQSAPGTFVAAGANLRLGEIAAAIGVAQMDKLDRILETRRALALAYRSALPDAGWQREPDGAMPNYQTLGLVLPRGADASARDDTIAKLRARGVEAGLLSYALHTVGSLRGAIAGGPLEVAASIADRGLALPLHPGMTAGDVDEVVAAVRAVIP